MIVYGAFEAKTQLSELLERVGGGEEIVITKHGVPVARLSPVQSVSAIPVEKVIAGFLETRKGITLGPTPLSELRKEGRM
ncbi:MAG: type II toxin-antitoxin system Phd/YefM family antitoxin [Spirochaetales bacterium]|nr:type II toxin-antitoxin system Phd/YefM family antitoxin [Spirochaetales bacterium]